MQAASSLHTVIIRCTFIALVDRHLTGLKALYDLGERGDIPKRKETLLKGETTRKRLGIPMFLVDL